MAWLGWICRDRERERGGGGCDVGDGWRKRGAVLVHRILVRGEVGEESFVAV